MKIEKRIEKAKLTASPVWRLDRIAAPEHGFDVRPMVEEAFDISGISRVFTFPKG